MQVSAGLVGLPNVGKSTLFNALTKSSVPAENYPFCTITPHTAITAVPDKRLNILKKIYNSGQIIPSTIKFVDIAGLVKGASSGAGLGNQFLSHIREVDLIIHVIRCFEDKDIIRSEPLNPLDDFDTIMTELILRDIESVTKRQEKRNSLLKSARSKPQELAALEQEGKALEKITAALNSSDIATLQMFRNCTDIPKDLLLATKNYLIVANLGESEYTIDQIENNQYIQALRSRFGHERIIPLSARLAHDLSVLTDEEAQDMLNLLNAPDSGLSSLIEAAYTSLNRITFFTCGPREIHAWPINNGITIREAAGEIHSDLQKGFICAEIIPFHEMNITQSETKIKLEGKMRTEGQEYIVQDGDIVNIKFNV